MQKYNNAYIHFTCELMHLIWVSDVIWLMMRVNWGPKKTQFNQFCHCLNFLLSVSYCIHGTVHCWSNGLVTTWATSWWFVFPLRSMKPKVSEECHQSKFYWHLLASKISNSISFVVSAAIWLLMERLDSFFRTYSSGIIGNDHQGHSHW